ncbi:S53 family peptidase [Mycolicibacterium aichiense]|uniref:S53 family peptidase n=1 Tax=Mycolicibacterium aichiense TaxID=1799 RepID=UPI000E1BF412|nr:S53 family peptidase [Mycolicibacterium aichiense]MCV7021242.1 peptidase S53 [Mycolicibacterium aichiense]
MGSIRRRSASRVTRISLIAVAALLVGLVYSVAPPDRTPAPPGAIRGPYASLLSASTDLGPSGAVAVQLVAGLRDQSRPDTLIGWAQQHGLSVRWRPGDHWATVTGAAPAVGLAFAVAVHDFRGRTGQVFYASPQQPVVPMPIVDEVTELGRILGYVPHNESVPVIVPLDVPDQGLGPAGLLRTYNAAPLRESGYTGQGSTVLVFAFDGFDQEDLDMFASAFDLPKFTPELMGDMPSQRSGEATMDLEAIHAVAPDAKTVLVNARGTVSGDGTYQKIGALMEEADRRYPGAIWSFSIGWGCDKIATAADLIPVRSALRAALRRGTTAFNASGDLAGLECKGGHNWSAPPSPDDVGLDSVASLPEMTDVGGTTLSTDADGRWLAEQSWFAPAISHGTGGGVSNLFERPPWQSELRVAAPPGRRLTPDIAAVADPYTGVRIVFRRQHVMGGGTSLAAPIWAGMTALMNDFLRRNGGGPIGELNPLLYEIAQGARLPAFRDVILGGNAVDDAGPGYDLVTGLGTPDLDHLARDILALQKCGVGCG